MLKLIKENIPEELTKKTKWVAFVIRDGQKTPIDPKLNDEFDYGTADISNPATWGTFEQAESLVANGVYPAVAYAMTPEDNLIFIDLDFHAGKCKSDEEKEELKKKYDSLCRAVEPFDTYMEKSVSGNGVHLLARGSLSEDLATGSSPTMPIEIYGNKDKRFIIMTGHKVNDCDISDSERTIGAISNLHKNYFTPKTTTNTSANGVSPDHPAIPPIDKPIRTDEEVLRVAMKNKDFELLWNGKWEQVVDVNGNQKYQQQHYADFVLVRKLTFYTGNCPEQVERLFRLSPCYNQYGKDGKWTKYESDIRKDIHPY